MIQAAARIQGLEQHVQQLQQEASNAGALEYRCEGLQQEKQQLVLQLQQLRGAYCNHHMQQSALVLMLRVFWLCAICSVLNCCLDAAGMFPVRSNN